jgi:hypothetical protein
MGPGMDKARTSVSVSNNILLGQLNQSVQSVASTLNGFIEKQGEENQRLHSRIDSTAMAARADMDEVREGLASRGRISGQMILSLVAVLLSAFAAFGGFGHAYVSTRLEKVDTAIASVDRRVDMLHVEVDKQRTLTDKDRVDDAYNRGRTEARLEELYRHVPPTPLSPRS